MQRLSYATKSLLWLGKVTAVCPIVLQADNAGKYTVTSTTPNIMYSLLLLVIVHTFSIIAALYLYIGYGAISSVFKIHLYGRVILTFLIHVRCFLNRKNIEEGFRATLAIESMLPMRLLIVPVSTILTTFCVSIMLDFSMLKTWDRIFLSIPLDLIPPIVLMSMSSLFASQVEALRSANVKLNQDILHIFSENNSTNIPTLRGIMKKYNELHVICQHVNKTYGMSMLLVTVQIFLETIMCGTEFATFFLVGKLGVLCFLWGSSHVAALFWAMHTCQRAEDVSKETQALSVNMNIATSHDHEQTTWLQAREWELQLRHQQIQFSACGCLCLSGQQIKTITATSISYAVIILQNVRLRYDF